MKVKFYHWYNFLLGALLSVVGYGCSSDGDEPVMYGSPTADYQISGVVTDENGNPVEGIKASLNHVDVKDGEVKVGYEIRSTKTDAEGRYTMDVKNLEGGIGTTGLQMQDVDGEEHGGTFKEKVVRMDPNKAQYVAPGDGQWNGGTFAIKQDVSLEKE